MFDSLTDQTLPPILRGIMQQRRDQQQAGVPPILQGHQPPPVTPPYPAAPAAPGAAPAPVAPELAAAVAPAPSALSKVLGGSLAGSGLLTKEQQKAAEKQALIQGGLAMLAGSGPSLQRQSLGQLLAGGVQAAQQGYQQAGQQAVETQAALEQHQRDAKKRELLAKFATGDVNPESMHRLFVTQLANGASAGELQATAEVLKWMQEQGGKPKMDVAIDSDDTTRTYYLKDWQGPGDPRSPKSPVIFTEPISKKQKSASEVGELMRFNAGQLNTILDDFDKNTKDDREVASRWAAMKAATAGPPNAISDYNIVDNFARMINPGKAMTMGNYAVIMEKAPYEKRLTQWMNKWQSKGEMDPDFRQWLVQQGQGVAGEHAVNMRRYMKQSQRRAKVVGIQLPQELLVDPYDGLVPNEDE